MQNRLGIPRSVLAFVVLSILILVEFHQGVKGSRLLTGHVDGRALTTTTSTVCAAPSSVATLNKKKGSIGSGQTAANLEGDISDPLANDESGSFSSDYVEFNPKRSGATYGIYFTFDENIDLSTTLNFTMQWNYRGENWAKQHWLLSVLDGSGSYQQIATNAEAREWVWLAEESTISDFELPSSSTLTLKLSSNNKKDAFQIDYIQVCVTLQVSDDDSDDDSGDNTDNGDDYTGDGNDSSAGEGTVGQAGAGIIEYTCPLPLRTDFAEWSYATSMCGIYVETSLTQKERKSLIQAKIDQGCSTILYDSPMSSYYRPDAQFEEELQWIGNFSADAEELGVKVMIYYPSLEVITENGENLDDTFGKEHPDWLQIRLDGSENLVYGSQAFWLEADVEDAWMSPTSQGYFEYMVGRLSQLAATGAAGVVLDVPVLQSYENSPWILGSDDDATSFKAWSKARGLCGTSGCSLPDMPSPKDEPSTQDEFKYWLVWRHFALGNFLAKVRAALDSNFLIQVEQYPNDYDATKAGLDGALMETFNTTNMGHIWEIDSVSEDTAMKFGSRHDFGNQITMRKFARGCDRDRPTWAFSIGYSTADAGIVMAGALAVGTNPLEHKAPYISDSVGSSFRTKWFTWLEDVACEIFNVPRRAEVAVLHSSSSRDLYDLYKECGYGMFWDYKRPNKKIEWWADSKWDALSKCPHLAGYRGASYALQLLHVPFKIVPEASLTSADLEGISVLWLPTVPALSEDAASVINTWVESGGILLASGSVTPASISGYGESVSTANNPLKATLNNFGSTPASVGDGYGYYKSSWSPEDVFQSTKKQTKFLETLESFLFSHINQNIIVASGSYILVEASDVYDNVQHLYVVNYAGLKQPAKSNVQTVKLQLLSMHSAGKSITRAVVTSPTSSATSGEVSVSTLSGGYFQINFKMSEFMLVTVQYE